MKSLYRVPGHGAVQGDAAFLKNLRQWLSKVKLGGNQFAIRVGPRDVFQAPRTVVNVQSYGVHIADKGLLSRIVKRCKTWEPGLQKTLGGKASLLNPSYGILSLHRRQFVPNSATRKRLGLDDRRNVVVLRDDYWLDIYAGSKGKEPYPILRIYHDSAGAFYKRRPPDMRRIAAGIVENMGTFTAPDEIILNWHDVATLLGRDRSATYLLACLVGGGASNSVLCQEEGPQGVPIPPVPGLLVGGISGHYQTLAPVLYDPFKVYFRDVAHLDFGSQVAALTLLEWQVRNHDHAAWRDPNPGEDLSSFPASDVRQYPRPLPFDRVPRPSPPSIGIGEALGGLFASAWGAGLSYIGGGFFSLRSSAFTQLAVGNGQWGSGEQLAVFVEVGAKGVTAAGAVAGLAPVVKMGADYWEDSIINADEAVDKCVENTESVAACRKCIADKLGLVTVVQMGAEVAGGVAAAIALLSAATLGVGLLLFAGVVVDRLLSWRRC